MMRTVSLFLVSVLVLLLLDGAEAKSKGKSANIHKANKPEPQRISRRPTTKDEVWTKENHPTPCVCFLRGNDTGTCQLTCPNDTMCTDHVCASEPATLKLCLQKCETVADCDENYNCTESTTGPGKVCQPLEYECSMATKDWNTKEKEECYHGYGWGRWWRSIKCDFTRWWNPRRR